MDKIPVALSKLAMGLLILGTWWMGGSGGTMSLAQVRSPETEIPEEMLQIQILEPSASQQNGVLLSADEYVHEQQQYRIAPADVPPRLAPEVKQVIDLLRIRKVIRGFLPFF
jgi:hypothetical protein